VSATSTEPGTAPRTAPPQKNSDGNIVCLNRPNCTQVFFVYAGAHGMVEGMGPMTFLQKSGISDRNIVFLRDPHACFFDRGVSEEIPTLDAVLDWHNDYFAANPHITEVYAVGNSFGGWAALFFGYILGFRKVWSLAPGGPWGLELLKDLMDDSNNVTEYDLYYSCQEPVDEVFAKSLEGYPGVRLVHLEEHGHLMTTGLLESGELPKLFPPFRAARGAAEILPEDETG